MELLFRGIARAGGIEVPAQVQIFEAPKRKPRSERPSANLAGAARVFALWLQPLVDRLATHSEPTGGRPVAP